METKILLQSQPKYEIIESPILIIKKQEKKLFTILAPATARNGKDGYSPIKGVDYWTPSDIETMENQIKEYIDTVILGGES